MRGRIKEWLGEGLKEWLGEGLKEWLGESLKEWLGEGLKEWLGEGRAMRRWRTTGRPRRRKGNDDEGGAVLRCLGMRIREAGEGAPKPMVTIGYRPILWHVMKYYAHYGHKDFVLCLGYRGDAIKNYLEEIYARGDAPWEVRNETAGNPPVSAYARASA